MDVNLHFLFRTRIHETFSDILCNTHNVYYYGSPIRGYSVVIQKYLYNKLQWVKEYLHVLRRKQTKKIIVIIIITMIIMIIIIIMIINIISYKGIKGLKDPFNKNFW